MVTPGSRQLDAPTIAFAGGGTGGHLYPALSLADAIRRRMPKSRFLFFATDRAIDGRIVDRDECELVRQTLPPLRLAPWRWPGILWGFHRSSQLCRTRLESSCPAVVIGTGGLSSVPAVREAHRRGIPTVLLNPDALPGRANRYLAGAADAIFVQWADTAEYFPPGAPVFVLGCPIRPGFSEVRRAAGIARFSLDADRRTLVVTGASQGARTVNDAVVANLDLFESLDHWQVLHLTGDRDHEAVREAYLRRSVRSRVVAFTPYMVEALAAADLIVARSGASTLAEITAVGVPSVLMPYPFHRDMHQLANARCLARVSAARIVQDANDPAVNGPALRRVLEQLITNPERRAAMAAAAQRMGRGNAAADIADRVLELAARRWAASPQAGTLGVEQTC